MLRLVSAAFALSTTLLLQGCEEWAELPGAIDVVGGPDALCNAAGDECKCPDGYSVIGQSPACGDGSNQYFKPAEIAGTDCRCEKNLECPDVQTQSGFDLDTFISKPWFIQQQMETEYLPASKNYCVNAVYTKKDSATIWGYTISVRNRAQEADGTQSDSGDGFLCAYGYDSNDPAKLAVAPCWLPTGFSGSYWVLAHNEAEGYALISGGQPTLATPRGCRTGTGTNDAGFWIFAREPQPDFALVEKVRGMAQAQGFDLSVLNNVSHANCNGEPYP